MRRFLIVDDNFALADNLAEIISATQSGEAVLAESGARALALAADTRFDALVSDVRMPNMSGVELVHRMRLVDPGLPVVLVTAYTTGDELRSSEGEGILCILPKPIPIARLLGLLARARRDGVVALVGPVTALREDLAEAMRSSGFAPVTVCSLHEVANLDASPFAAVVTVGRLGDLDEDALLHLATVSPQLPILFVAANRQLSKPALRPDVLMSWSEPETLIDALEALCSRPRFTQRCYSEAMGPNRRSGSSEVTNGMAGTGG